MIFILPALFLALLLFWIFELRDVVLMRDEEFEGRNDKLIWFLLVFFGSVLGACAFQIWKVNRKREKETERELKRSLNDITKNL